VYGAGYRTARGAAASILRDEPHLRRMYRRLGDELGHEAARWLHLSTGRPKKMDSGGYLPPGMSVVDNQTGGWEYLHRGHGGPGPAMHVEHQHIHNRTDVELLAQRVAWIQSIGGGL
jgi:hypothetical protein